MHPVSRYVAPNSTVIVDTARTAIKAKSVLTAVAESVYEAISPFSFFFGHRKKRSAPYMQIRNRQVGHGDGLRSEPTVEHHALRPELPSC